MPMDQPKGWPQCGRSCLLLLLEVIPHLLRGEKVARLDLCRGPIDMGQPLRREEAV